jgi:hypothetical protein
VLQPKEKRGSKTTKANLTFYFEEERKFNQNEALQFQRS